MKFWRVSPSQASPSRVERERSGRVMTVAISRAERRKGREPRVVALFGESVAPAALDLLELTEFAWHDCYGDITPPDEVVDDMLVCSEGDLGKLVVAARLAVRDWRDLRIAADTIRAAER